MYRMAEAGTYFTLTEIYACTYLENMSFMCINVTTGMYLNITKGIDNDKHRERVVERVVVSYSICHKKRLHTKWQPRCYYYIHKS